MISWLAELGKNDWVSIEQSIDNVNTLMQDGEEWINFLITKEFDLYGIAARRRATKKSMALLSKMQHPSFLTLFCDS
jgi:hypothetical protein